ncbi:heparinase II/III family protein [Prosthecobacter sp.]|uniref:heparinase II/III family protein n=1 Tax=Prosthecobacter sp. TaxID=1965333 RepID=UPI001D85AC30|nr:heparinase II/III family protein [Prosthecobacter sp.]MCB1275811.1 heparinase II/III family protein [Prosthecobacter sp.]
MADDVGTVIQLEARSGAWSETIVPDITAKAESFALELRIDPVVAAGGDLEVVAGFVLGLEKDERVQDGVGGQLRVDFREGGDRAAFTFWHRKTCLTMIEPDPKPPGWMENRDYQHPHVLPLREGTGHRMKLVVWPEGDGSRVRLFVDFMDRPVEEHALPERIRAGVLKLFTMRGGQEADVAQTSHFTDVRFSKVTSEQANELPSMAESVLRALDFSHPAMQPVAQAIQQGRMNEAKALLLRHMRTRRDPKGPTIEEVASVVLHPNWQKISDEAVAGRYATIGYFDGFVEAWKDTNGDTHKWVLQEKPLQLNWARDNGHLNRHFHWVSMARAWQGKSDSKYPRQFSAEVLDWVSREPFFWSRCPAVGGVNLMDGTTFRWGFMNTSNIGRRLEMSWWPAYEVFRKSPDFSDEAHIAILLGMLRQARLIMNPSSFAAHDDGGAHTTLALLQTALLLPEFKESAEWKATAMKRWDVMLDTQFHPDGSHSSLSTGYNWASITALENYIRLFERFGESTPEKYLKILEKAVEHPMLLTAPNQAQVDLNDGGWSTIEDRYQSLLKWFPDRTDFRWMATKGAEGARPEQTSVYFPNAGHYVMRTGWGPEEKYLFFGAGPWGASHGKFDALNIYAQFGPHLLIRNAGRGSYSGVGNTKHAGQSLSFNTLSPDWAHEDSIPQWRQDMAIGFDPPTRRWVDNDRFCYGEGAFTYGWYNSEEHIQGKWLRQLIFVKGNEPRRDGYYIVIDTVEPKDNKMHTWRHPWQLGLNAGNIAIRNKDKSATAIAPGIALQILPVDPVGDLEVSMIQGQEKPELLGWRIYDTTANPWPVPTYHWQTDKTFCRAWIIQMQQDESQWPVVSATALLGAAAGELRFKVRRRDGGHDFVIRRVPGTAPTMLDAEEISGDVAVISRDRSHSLTAKLELKDGLDSVARLTIPQGTGQ